jgi:hypothetical protein
VDEMGIFLNAPFLFLYVPICNDIGGPYVLEIKKKC